MIKSLLASVFVATAANAAVLIQWESTLTPDVGLQPFEAVAVLDDSAPTVITYTLTYDWAAVGALSTPIHWTEHGPDMVAVDLISASPFVFSRSVTHNFVDWIGVLDGAHNVLYATEPERYVAEGFWSMTVDNRPDEPGPPGGGEGEPGGGEGEPDVPEPGAWAVVAALGLCGFAVARRRVKSLAVLATLCAIGLGVGCSTSSDTSKMTCETAQKAYQAYQALVASGVVDIDPETVAYVKIAAGFLGMYCGWEGTLTVVAYDQSGAAVAACDSRGVPFIHPKK